MKLLSSKKLQGIFLLNDTWLVAKIKPGCLVVIKYQICMFYETSTMKKEIPRTTNNYIGKIFRQSWNNDEFCREDQKAVAMALEKRRREKTDALYWAFNNEVVSETQYKPSLQTSK